MRPLALSLAIVLGSLCLPVGVAQGQATGTGDGSRTGDGTTPFTGLAQAPEADLFLGSATTRIAIQVPPNRGSLTPQLALAYNSSAGPSPYGYGWDLSLPRLQRTATHGVLSCTDTAVRNELVLTLPGTSIECTVNGSGRCEPHVESGFIRIQRVDSNATEFTATDKSGIVYTFGGDGAVTTTWTGGFSPAAGQKAVTGSSTTIGFDTNASPCRYIATWALRKVEDPNGNTMEYRYIRDGEMLYPHSIVYGGNSQGPSHLYTVQFLWQTRSDAPVAAPSSAVEDTVVNARGGHLATMSYRLWRINVLYGTELVRGYTATYETARVGRQTFLESVTLRGSTGGALENGDGEIASTVFVYRGNHPDGAGFEVTTPQVAVRPALIDPPRSLRVRELSGTRRDVLDLNGDGFPDLIDAAIGAQCKPDPVVPTHRFWTVYLGSEAGFDTAATRWYLPPTSALPACIIRGVLNDELDSFHDRFATADITGDGLPDLIDAQITTGAGNVRQWTVYPSTHASPYGPGPGFGAAQAWTFATGEGVGRDYVRRSAPTSLGNFHGYSGDAVRVFQNLLDINGDGLQDLVRTCGTSCNPSTNWEVYLNRGDGTGFRPREFFTGRFEGLTLTTSPPSGTLYTVADVNGDGLPDQLRGRWRDTGPPYFYEVCFNTGHAMDVCRNWDVASRADGAVVQENYNGPLNTIRDFVDMNGDGLPDVVDKAGFEAPGAQDWRVFLNRGSGIEAAEIAWRAPRSLMREAGETGDVTTWDTFDIDGDDMVDFVDFYNGGAATYLIYRTADSAWKVENGNVVARPSGIRPDLLTISENGVGSKTMLRYRPSTEWDNHGGDSGPDLPFNLWSVTQICHDDGLGSGTCDQPDGGHQVGMRIAYEGGRYDPVERELRGFARVTTDAIASGSAPRRGSLTVYHQTSALAGKVDLSFTYDASNAGTYFTRPIARTANEWECFNLETGALYAEHNCPANPGEAGGAPAGDIWVRLALVDEATFSNFDISTLKSSQTVTLEWDQCDGEYFGNPNLVRQGAQGGPHRYTHTEYACSSTAYMVDRPKYVKALETSGGNVLEERWLHYDTDQGSSAPPFGRVTRGNLTKVESWLDQGGLGLTSSCSQKGSAQCVVSTMAYDDRGLLTQSVDANGKSTTISYDSATKIYPETVSRPLGLKVTTAYDPKCGALLTESVPYTGSTVPQLWDRLRHSHDAFCRLEKVFLPGQSTTTPYKRHIYKLGAPGKATATITDTYEPNNLPSAVTSSSVLGDGLGRVIQRKQQSTVDGALKVVTTTSSYDGAGNLAVQTVPVALDSATAFDVLTPVSGVGTTTMQHDAVGRLTRVTHPDNTYRTVEVDVAWQTTTKDECFTAAGCTGAKTVETVDGLGRTVDRKEIDEGGTLKAATRFVHDALDRLRETRQGDGSSWNANTAVTTVYDSLGRRVSVTDPDTGTGAAGQTRFGYDRAGNLRYQDDPTSGRHVQFCYDALNRVAKKQYFRTGDFAALANCANNVSEQITYSYDAATTYGAGRLSQVVDLSGTTRITTYSALGQPGRVERIMAGVTAYTLHSYDVLGRLTQMRYPDDEYVSYVYGPAGQLKGMGQTSLNPVYLANLTYDVFGRPRVVTHGNGTVDTREYESTAALNYRLKRITAAGPGTTYFRFDYPAYDAGGRLKQIDDTTASAGGSTPSPYPAPLNADASFTYDGIGRLLESNEAVAGLRTYGYDLWGNITQKEGTTITYGAGKPHQPTGASGSLVASFTHDGNGNRTNRTASGLDEPQLDYLYDMDDRLRLIDAGGEGVEFTYDYTGRRTKEIRGTVIADPQLGKKVEPNGAVVTYHYSDLLEVTHDPNAVEEFVQRKYYFAGSLLVASQERFPPPQLQVAGLDAGARGIQVAGLLGEGGPRLLVQLAPSLAHAAGAALLLGATALLCLPGRRRAVVGVRVRPGQAILLAVAVTVTSLPWPLLIGPAHAGGPGPGPTPTPVPGPTVHHYHLDHLGSPQAVTDGAGGFVKQLRYGPYGEVRTYGTGAFSAWDDREFTGYQKEPLSDHYYAGARYYDPDFALFLSHDPARQFASPYTYTNWNPLGRTDPNGAVADIVAGFDTLATLATAVDDVAAASATATAGNSGAGAVSSARSDPSPSVDDFALKNPGRQIFVVRGFVPRADQPAPTDLSSLAFNGVADTVRAQSENSPSGLDALQATLDATSLAADASVLGAPVGIAADGANGLISAARGDFLGAGLSMLSAFPYIGSIGNAARLGRTVATSADAARAPGVVNDFFAGTHYTDKVIAQMTKGDFHGFPRSVEGFQDAGQVTRLTGGDGQVREMLTIPGGYRGREGQFEFIKDADGTINHRYFQPHPKR